MAEKQIEVETDKTRLKILRDAWANFRDERLSTGIELRNAKIDAARIDGHLRQLRRVCLGEAAGQESVVFIWSAFYFFLLRLPPPFMDVPPEAMPNKNFTMPVGMRPDTRTPVSYLLQLRAKNCLPKLDSPAIRYVLAIMWAMSEEAAKLQTAAEAKIDEYRERLDKIETASWQQLFGGGGGDEQ